MSVGAVWIYAALWFVFGIVDATILHDGRMFLLYIFLGVMPGDFLPLGMGRVSIVAEEGADTPIYGGWTQREEGAWSRTLGVRGVAGCWAKQKQTTKSQQRLVNAAQ